MKRQPQLYIEHILKSITLIEEYTLGATKDDFVKSVKLQDLAMRGWKSSARQSKDSPLISRAPIPKFPGKKLQACATS